MISTQLDLFGGPPKPPKNIREEEPPIVAKPAEENAVEPPNEPGPAIQEGLSDAPVVDEEKGAVQGELPEWIDEPTSETGAEIDLVPEYEPNSDVFDAPLEDYIPQIEVEKDPEVESEPEEETEPEDEPNAVDTTFTDPIPEIEDERETDAIEYDYEAPIEGEDVQDNEKDALETLDAPIPEDTVHVQLPSHNASPIIFTSLIPVESFVVDEEHHANADDIQQDNIDSVEVKEKGLDGLKSDAGERDLQDEEPPSPPFMVEAITTEDIIIGGEPEVDLDDANTEDALETKEGQLQIPEDEKLFLRQYYTMRETSNMFGVNQSLLRYWENEFDVLKPKKNRKGDRYFRPEDIKNLELIYHLLKVRKFTIEGAREYIKSKKKVLDTFELVQRLEKLKGFLHELKTHL